MTRSEIIHEDVHQVFMAIRDVLAENGVADAKIATLLSDIVQAGTLADKWCPLDMFDVYNHGSEAVKNAVFRVNALVSHAKD